MKPIVRKILVYQIGVVLLCFSACRSEADRKAEQMLTAAKHRVMPRELQAAMSPLCDQYRSNTMVPIAAVPKEILSLSAERPTWAAITYRVQDPARGTLMVCWGGAFGRWGVLVCPVGGELDTDVEARLLPWTNGVAFFVGKH